jgi:hypothetical protein
MSFTENDRKVQSKHGKPFPEGEAISNAQFIAAIASALKAEFGGSPGAVKTVSRITMTNERAVRNWFEGKNGPSGENLIRLIYRSDPLLRTVLRLAGRSDLVVSAGLGGLRQKLVDTITAIDNLQVPIGD